MPDDPNAAPEGEQETPPEGAETPGATGETDPTPPEGAENPDAVRAALRAEREAAKAARADARAAKAAAAEAEALVASLTGERDSLASKLAEAEGTIPELTGKLDRYEVAAETGLDLSLALRLTGSTREELAADAAELRKLIGGGADFDGGARTPAPSKGTPEQEHGAFIAGLLRGGGTPTD